MQQRIIEKLCADLRVQFARCARLNADPRFLGKYDQADVDLAALTLLALTYDRLRPDPDESPRGLLIGRLRDGLRTVSNMAGVRAGMMVPFHVDQLAALVEAYDEATGRRPAD